MSLKSTTEKYGGVAIALHWMTAVLIVVLLASGFRAAATLDPLQKAAILRAHAPLGIAVLVLTLARLGWLLIDGKPMPVAGISRIQHLAAKAVHLLLYVAIVFMAATGIGMFVLSGAGPIVFGRSGALPDFWQYQPRLEHFIAARVLIGLLILHVGAALYHHFVVRDGLIRRMLPGRT
jgi:cytochrome b561